MQLFYAPDIVTNQQLPEAEAQHCLKVLRMQTGDSLRLTDGKGFFYRAEITETFYQGIAGQARHGRGLNYCKVILLETIPQPPLWKGTIEIALAPTKNTDRMEWFAEKATEIGIDKISFLRCRFSERKEMSVERIRKIMIAAMKQSEKARLPVLQTMTDFKEFIRQDFNGQKFIAHCYPDKKVSLAQVYETSKNVQILIGPEGDFSEEEISFAKEKGFIPVSLGESRLRTETAALTACQTIHIVNQMNNG
jgi:16S rRNA (uracil1498-N3)-methyltransferase